MQYWVGKISLQPPLELYEKTIEQLRFKESPRIPESQPERHTRRYVCFVTQYSQPVSMAKEQLQMISTKPLSNKAYV